MFKQFGYYKEYYINNKYIGSIICEKDRDIIGYNGKITENIQTTIKLDNNKVIKANSIVDTFLYPLCGRKI